MYSLNAWLFCWIKMEQKAHLGNSVTLQKRFCGTQRVLLPGHCYTCVHVHARMLPHRSWLNLLVPSAKRSWRGWDCRLEPVPLSLGLIFHLLYFEGSSCPYLHLPPFPIWAEAELSHGSGRNHVVLPPLPQGHTPTARRGWHFWEHGISRVWLGSSVVVRVWAAITTLALKQTFPLLTLC